jgi:hypothetical protein
VDEPNDELNSYQNGNAKETAFKLRNLAMAVHVKDPISTRS